MILAKIEFNQELKGPTAHSVVLHDHDPGRLVCHYEDPDGHYYWGVYQEGASHDAPIQAFVDRAKIQLAYVAARAEEAGNADDTGA